MRISGLLFALHEDEGTADIAAVRQVGGTSLLARQIRQLRAVGIEDILLLVDQLSPALAHIIAQCRRAGSHIRIVRGHDALADAVDATAYLMCDEALLIDERLLDGFMHHVRAQNEAASEHGTPLIAIWPNAHAPADAERINAGQVYGGVALMPAKMLELAREWPSDWDAQSAFLRALSAHPETQSYDFSTLDSYSVSRRRHVPMNWFYIRDTAQARAATDIVLAGAQKGCLDWPARFLHPPIENFLTRLLLPTPITPNMISLFVFFIGLGAAYAFAMGWLWTGLIAALIVGPLDGVDGKLARTRMAFSRWGDLEHVGDKIVEYLWYICLALHFDALWAWAVAALIICFALAEALQGEFYRRFTGQQLDDTGVLERRFRLISGRRNTFFWTFLPFALFQAWHIGYVTIAVYAVLTFFFMQWRFFVRLAVFGRQHSTVINQSFAATAYAFLPGQQRSAR